MASGGPTETNKVESVEDDEGNKFVNQYQILKKLGKGSYGKVKLAQRQDNGEKYAIKIISKSLLKRKRVGKGNAFQNVLHEMAIMKKLDHPHCVKLFEIMDDPGNDKLYLVLEFVDGGSTMSGAVEGKALSPDTTWSYFRDLIIGLEYLHFNGIIHRDIKPENLLLTKDGRVKLADFGVSQIVPTDDDSVAKSAGTPAFAAPETCSVGNFSAKAVDLWACGITLYYFTFGRCPFMAANVLEIYKHIKEDPLTFPSAIPDDLQDLLERMLQKDPANRITMEGIKVHPYVTRGGTQPLDDSSPSLGHKIAVTEAEVNLAVRNIDKLAMLIKLKSKMAKNLSHARDNLAKKRDESSTPGGESTPSSSVADDTIEVVGADEIEDGVQRM